LEICKGFWGTAIFKSFVRLKRSRKLSGLRVIMEFGELKDKMKRGRKTKSSSVPKREKSEKIMLQHSK